MIRRRHAVLLALGLLAPLALVDSPAGAIDQDLTASVTVGPPGTVVTLSSASCTASGDNEAFFDVRLSSGTEPDLKVAGFASGDAGEAQITIPDWLDPDQPATFEASCTIYNPETGSDDALDYDPLAFDVEPGAGTPIQVPTFSRTELLSGQGTLVSGAGCGDAARVMVVAIAGTDLSGRTETEEDGAYAFDGLSGGSFETELAMTNSYVGIEVGGTSEDDLVLSTYESPNTMAPGPYSVFPYCVSENSALVLEPTVIELTGTVDTTNVDLTGLPSSGPDLNFAGVCTEGDVAGSLDGQSFASIVGEPLARTSTAGPRNLPGAPQAGDARIRATGNGPAIGADRVITEGTTTEFEVTPDETGAWSVEDAPDFDDGFVMGFADCGDTLGDGYFYDGQVIDFLAPPVIPTVPDVVPTTVPAPPATAVAGTPTYAG